MPPTLSVTRDGASSSYPVEGSLTIGRAVDNVVLLDGENVSRHHAVLTASPTGVTFTDLGSANGSRVRGADVSPREPVPISNGDEIQIGDYTLKLETAAVLTDSARTAVMPPPEAASRQTVGGPSGTAVLSAWLEIDHAGQQSRTPLSADSISVGRAETDDIVIDSQYVSRGHFILRRSGPSFIAENRSGTNGLRVNGQPVAAHLLADGDLIQPADGVSVRFRSPGLAPAAGGETSLQLGDNKEVTVGRDPGCDVPLPHPAVSLRHAKVGLFSGDGAAYVEDLGSTNGTFINGARLPIGQKVPMRAGDVVQVGPFRLAIGATAATAAAWVDHSREIGITAVGLHQQVRKDLNLLQDLSFVIKRQEFVAVVGVSGAGKSTLLGALSGFRPASQGDVMLNGVSLYENFDAFRTAMGYVPQDDILHKELPVNRALGYAAELRLPGDTTRRERDQRVRDVIAEMGLEERRDTTIGQLSGGQRKRVSIGAELLTEPGLFFLDEATSGLDPGTESQLMRLLRGLADSGHTIVLITHATKNVMLCDQVVFLAKGGYLAYYGPPEEALKYFGVDDFDGIYLKVEGELTPAEWGARYKQSPLYGQFVESRLKEEGLSTTARSRASGLRPFTASPPRSAGGASALKQLSVLSRRYFDIIRRDRISIALLLLLAPILGSLDFLLYDRKILTAASGDATRAMTMLFLASLIPFLVGSLAFVREIVKEAPIYSRERAVSLQIWPYLASKVAVAIPLAAYHAGMLFLIKILAVDFPGLTAAGFGALYLTLVLACVSGVMWALLISTITTKEEQAMLLVIALIIIQMTFSGHVVPLASLGPAGTVAGGINSTAWAYKGLAAAGGVTTEGCTGDFSTCDLPGVAGKEAVPSRQLTYEQIDESFGGVLDADVVTCWIAMTAIILALGVILFILQKRKDKL